MADPRASVIRLHTVAGIVWASLMGSVLAGTYLMWLNYRALGKPALASKVLRIGVVVFFVLMGVIALLPSTGLRLALSMATQTLLPYFAAKHLQGQAINHHRANGHDVYSVFYSVLVGIVISFVVLAVMLFIGVLYLGITGAIVPPPS